MSWDREKKDVRRVISPLCEKKYMPTKVGATAIAGSEETKIPTILHSAEREEKMPGSPVGPTALHRIMKTRREIEKAVVTGYLGSYRGAYNRDSAPK